VTANPDKCIFGAESVEFVGHVLDAEGITFSKIKFASVVDFIKPSNLKELRSFVGLVNYFRDHIQGHSIITQPLHKMIMEGDQGRPNPREETDATYPVDGGGRGQLRRHQEEDQCLPKAILLGRRSSNLFTYGRIGLCYRRIFISSQGRQRDTNQIQIV
jgi:hypothetical protein